MAHPLCYTSALKRIEWREHGSMKARRGFSTQELTRQVRRLVAARLFLYLGAMSSYFIGVMGTLTFAMGAGVGDNAIAVALLNMCMVAGR